MRVLFTLLPGTGCLHPLLPLARSLAGEGHDVAFCSSPSMRSDVERHGMAFFAAGPDWHTSDPGYIEVLCEAAGGVTFPALSGMERLAWVTDHLFIRGAARRMLPDVVAVAREWPADLIVRQFLEFSGCAAGDALAIPHVSVADAAHSGPDLRPQLAAPLDCLRADLGLAPDYRGDMAYRHLHLCFMPARFDGRSAVFPATARFFRHTNAAISEAVPAWVDDLPDRPTVLASMGTVFHRTPGIYEAILDGLRQESVNLIVAIGFDQNPARLGPQPAHVRVEPYLPLASLLPHCDLFITHGGFNSVKESLSAGVPMMVIPISGDQPYSAQRCADLGVALSIPPDERTPSGLRRAARDILEDPAYRSEARQMQAEMAALPDIDDAVRLLEELHRAHRTGTIPSMPVAVTE